MMADNSIDKIKEQCLELILNVMPVSQLAFVFVIAVIFDRLKSNKGTSTINSLRNLGLESFFGVNSGLFWNVGILVLGAAFFLALINTFFLKRSLRYSFACSNVSNKLSGWATAAREAVTALPLEDKLTIHKSVGLELEKRLKKYQAKRMLAESMFSIVSCILFGSLYLVIITLPAWSVLKLSFPDLAVVLLSLAAWLGIHRNSVQYAISKVIPLQVYLSATTGEIAFFIDID